MTSLKEDFCTRVKPMSREQVTVEMDKTALYLARGAAEAMHMSLGDWLSMAARKLGIEFAAEQCAESERRHPDEPPRAWTEERLRLMFDEDER